MTGVDPAMAAALDRLTPPPISLGFADRVMALTEARSPLPPVTAPRTTRRSRWVRGRNIVLGVAGFGLLSATAAASGLLGKSAQSLPVIAQIADRIAPQPKPRHVVRKAEQPKPRVVVPAVAPLVSPIQVPEPQPVTREEVHRELIARRIAERLARRETENGGLPRGRIPPAVRERLRQMPPDERRALLARIRQIRSEQAGAVPPPPERAVIIERAKEIEARRAARRGGAEVLPGTETAPMQRLGLSPEQRQKLREMIERRRALRNQQPVDVAEPTVPAPQPEYPE